MKEKNYAEIIYVFSSFIMLLTFTGAFIYYIVFKKILIYLVILGFIAFAVGFFAKNSWDKSRKS